MSDEESKDKKPEVKWKSDKSQILIIEESVKESKKEE